jgi:hypothetical protein
MGTPAQWAQAHGEAESSGFSDAVSLSGMKLEEELPSELMHLEDKESQNDVTGQKLYTSKRKTNQERQQLFENM